jgi:hypothetical protein
MGIWCASELVLVLVSSWVLRRAAGYSVVEQFGGALNPFIASGLMAAVVIETRLQLSAELGPILRLSMLLPLGALTFAGAIFLLDRRLVNDFLGFARTAFDGKWKKSETS